MKTSTFMLFYCCICTTEGKQKRVSTYSGRLFPNNTCLSISFSFLTTQWRIVLVYGTSKQPRLILCWTLMSHFKDLSNVRRFYPCLHFLDILILQHINNVHLLTCWQFLKMKSQLSSIMWKGQDWRNFVTQDTATLYQNFQYLYVINRTKQYSTIFYSHRIVNTLNKVHFLIILQ